MTILDRIRGRRLGTRTAETLARLDVMVEVLEGATTRLEASAKTLDNITNRHLEALETNGSDDAEA